MWPPATALRPLPAPACEQVACSAWHVHSWWQLQGQGHPLCLRRGHPAAISLRDDGLAPGTLQLPCGRRRSRHLSDCTLAGVSMMARAAVSLCDGENVQEWPSTAWKSRAPAHHQAPAGSVPRCHCHKPRSSLPAASLPLIPSTRGGEVNRQGGDGPARRADEVLPPQARRTWGRSRSRPCPSGAAASGP